MRLARVFLLAGLATGATACMTTRVVQRDGCWVRQTKKTLHGMQEEIGPCVKPPPRWSDDRLTRLVQECVAQADYRWQVRAVSAWSRHEPIPEQDAQGAVVKACMSEATAQVLTENDALRQRGDALQQRMAEIAGDRDAFRAEASQGNQHLRASADKLADYLGEAAKRPPPVATATATATSDGTATSDTGLQADNAASGSVPAPTALAASPVVPAAAAPATAPSASAADAETKRLVAKAARKRALARSARNSGCELPAPATTGTAASPPPATPAAPAPAAQAGASR